MKFLTLLLWVALCASPVVFAHVGGETVQAGPYSVEVGTEPSTLEPGKAVIVVHVFLGEEPVPQKLVWLRLRNDKTIYFAGTLMTDGSGSIPFTYTFTGPGQYLLDVEVDGNRVALPIHVHGQYVLLFGFLAAIFIVVALLLEKI